MKKEKFDLIPRGENNHLFGFFDPLFDDFFDEPMLNRHELKKLSNMMKTDVKEREKDYVIEVEMPGIDKKDVNLTLNNGYLTIEAHREHHQNEENKKENFIRRERSYGSFSRSFYVGDIKQSEIDAKLENGVLQIIVPKNQKQIDSSTKIEIK